MDRQDFELILWAYNERGYSKGARGIYMCMLHCNPACTHEPEKDSSSDEKVWLEMSHQKIQPI